MQLRNLSLACAAFMVALGAPSDARAEFLFGRLLGAGGLQPNGSSNAVDVSANGKTVVFSTGATNWVSGPDYNGDRVVAVDLDTGVVETISRAFEGAVFRGEAPAVSADGRYVAFLTFNVSYGPNWQVLRKDRQTGVLDVVSATAAAVPADIGTNDDTVSISGDGRYVAFETSATNFGVATGANYEVFVKDMLTGAVSRASLTSSGGASGGTCEIEPHALSGNGRYLVMVCGTAMVPGASSRQLYLRDLQANTTELLSRVGSSATSSTAQVLRPAISPNGRFVSFQNRGFGGLGYADGANANSNSGVYVRDRQTQTTIPVPRPAVISAADYDSCSTSAVSDIGSVLLSCDFNISPTSRVSQVFLFIPGQGAPILVSTNAANQPGNGASGTTLAVNASGLSMVWESTASNIDPQDTNGASDIFVLVDSSVLSDVIVKHGFEN
jgi:hypothetical protein